MKLSEWILVDGYCAVRTIENGDPENIKDRFALIEKTPRIRLTKNKYCIERSKDGIGCASAMEDAWIYGPKGKDLDSRK